MSQFMFGLFRSALENNQLYLDPGSGSFLLQLLIASGLGALFVLRSSWSKIKSFFGKDTLDQNEEGDDLDE